MSLVRSLIATITLVILGIVLTPIILAILMGLVLLTLWRMVGQILRGNFSFMRSED